LRTTLAALFALVLLLGGRAVAQSSGFSLDRFTPAPTSEDGLALLLPHSLGHLRPAFALTLDYAHRPLVIAKGGDRAGSPVEHRLLGHFTAALGLGTRLELFVRAPVLLLQRGDLGSGVPLAEALPTSAAFGTLHVGASVRLLGDDDGPLQLGLAAWAEAPTGRPESLTGDDGAGGAGLLTGSAHTEAISFAVNVGGRYRPRAEYGSARVGAELLLGAGAYAYAGPYATFLAELTGAVQLRDMGSVTTRSAPFEALLGLRIGTPLDVSITAGASLGLTRAIGVPDARGLFQLAYPAPRRALAAGDLDGDHIDDDHDRCPTVAEDQDQFQDDDGCPELDNDQDGLPDRRDRCVDEAEDQDGHEDDDGCPELDNDQDGIADEQDKCPYAPEDRDGWADADGCADLDNDKDGLLDLRDTCRDEAEDIDGFGDEDGCPDPDNDKDQILDREDKCPTVPGPRASDGCPSAVRIDEKQIRILERIEFPTRRAEIRPDSLGVLDQVRSALEVNPQILRIRIEGHTDNRGANAANLKLSQRRAEAVMKYLIREGIDPLRLEAKGWGEERPLVKNDSEANMQINRRVEFHLVDPAPRSPGSP
jgi:outer membrane protein OmpA-like peptidoglycan-associated protein